MKFYSQLAHAKYAVLTVAADIFRITSASDYQGQENARIMTAGIRVPVGHTISWGLETVLYRQYGDYPGQPKAAVKHDASQMFLSASF